MTQIDLFSGPRARRRLPLPDAEIFLWSDFLDRRQADWLFAELFDNVTWRQDRIRVFGREHPIPRLHQWFADDELPYTWSGLTMYPAPWLPALLALRARLHTQTGQFFDTTLANLYRDGNDTVGWHADNEATLGPKPVIASVSLGAEREFQLRHQTRHGLKHAVRLPHGSLLFMSGPTQRHWHHCLPRRKRVKEPRINLTFRVMNRPGSR